MGFCVWLGIKQFFWLKCWGDSIHNRANRDRIECRQVYEIEIYDVRLDANNRFLICIFSKGYDKLLEKERTVYTVDASREYNIISS